jgi:hypothetical protein
MSFISYLFKKGRKESNALETSFFILEANKNNPRITQNHHLLNLLKLVGFKLLSPISNTLLS